MSDKAGTPTIFISGLRSYDYDACHLAIELDLRVWQQAGRLADSAGIVTCPFDVMRMALSLLLRVRVRIAGLACKTGNYPLRKANQTFATLAAVEERIAL
jgi:hypothetical protein